MTTITDSTLPALRARFGQALASRLPEHISRLDWDARRLADHQREQLRALLARALERSPFHARRLTGIDPGRFEPGQLAELPVMTKQQMMAGFDELLTDRRVTRARAEQQLAACAHEPSLLDCLITEHLAVRDDVTILRQLGALPTTSPSNVTTPASETG